MIQKVVNGIDFHQFKDLDIKFGLLIIMYGFMEASTKNLQMFQLIQSSKLIYKNYLQTIKI